MKTVKLRYLSGWEDTITRVSDVLYNKDDNVFVIKAEDDNFNLILPREIIRLIHIKEETESGN